MTTTTYHGDFQWKILDHIVKLMQNDPYLTSKVNKRVYSQHISTVANPLFPAITISRVGLGGDPSIDEIDYTFLNVDVWSKVGPDELWAIYANFDSVNHVLQGVRGLLHNKGFRIPEANVDLCTQIYVVDNLWEKETKTFHLVARFRINAAANVVNF
jgi:hypothetical protein